MLPACPTSGRMQQGQLNASMTGRLTALAFNLAQPPPSQHPQASIVMTPMCPLHEQGTFCQPSCIHAQWVSALGLCGWVHPSGFVNIVCCSVGWPTEKTLLSLQSDGEGMAAEAKPAEEPEPGEILAAAVPKPEELQLLAPRDSLPKLEELIAAATGPSVDPVSEHAVLSGGLLLLSQVRLGAWT